MSLVTDTWGINLNPPPKTFTVAKVLSATAMASGTAVTDTKNFFNKDCPFPVEVVGVQGVMRDITASGIGASGSVTVTVQASQEVDVSPAAPTTPTWDTLMSAVQCSGVAVDGRCFDAPADGTNTLDQTYVAVPEGGSLRATLSNKQDSPGIAGANGAVEILVIAEFRPTRLKEQRYF